MNPGDSAPGERRLQRLTSRVAGLLGLWRAGCDEVRAAPRKKKKTRRQKLYYLHAWVGFHLAVIMTVVLFTGTFATISKELDWLANPAMRVAPDGDQVSWQTMIDAVREHDPATTIVGIGAGVGDHFAYGVVGYDGEGIAKVTFVDQWTGEVTGHGGIFNIKYFFRQLHRYLFLPSYIGLTIVSSMAIILSISLYTGLKTSRNWRTLMTRIRFSKGARVAIGDAHKAAGLWSIWFFLLIISTGLWYYAEFLGTGFEPEQPTVAEERLASMADVLVDPKVSEILAAAKAAYPDLQISGVNYGAIAGPGPTIVGGTVGNPIVRERANAVFLDPFSLEVIHVARDRDLGWLQWINQIVDPLHFGNFGGLPLKLIWFTFGLFMTSLSISGVWLTWRRLKSRGASRMQLAVLPILLLAGVSGSLTYVGTNLPFQSGIDLFAPAWFVVGLWLGGLALIGLWFMINRLRRPDRKRLTVLNAIYSILILAAAGSAVHATVLQQPFAEPVEQALGKRITGPIAAELFLTTESDGELNGAARMIIAGLGGRLNLKAMSARLKDGTRYLGDEDDATKRNLGMHLHAQPVYFELPEQKVSTATDIEVIFEMNSGKEYSTTWPLERNNGN